jgi:hypothetical protein
MIERFIERFIEDENELQLFVINNLLVDLGLRS